MTPCVTRITHSPEETQALAAELAATLKPGQCIALDGELGAGKTQFVRGLLTGLGGDPRTVSSPTFVLLNIYDTGRLPLFHLDAYRVCSSEDFESIGFAELLEQEGLVVIEWASQVATALPADRINVTISLLSPNDRAIIVDRPTE